MENLICLCRKHHQAHENGRIADITLQCILYNFYGYGPDPGTVMTLDAVKDMVQDDFGLPLRVDCKDGRIMMFSMTGTSKRAEIPMTVGFIENISTQMAVEILKHKLHSKFGGSDV